MKGDSESCEKYLKELRKKFDLRKYFQVGDYPECMKDVHQKEKVCQAS